MPNWAISSATLKPKPKPSPSKGSGVIIGNKVAGPGLSQYPSGQSAGMLPLVNDYGPVDEDVGNAIRVLMWVRECRPIGDGLGIE